uniref:Activin_recp domain-containing protein n=1 Tax=Heterorhabditis bacteriophora TaxID=37862 RepID=A0A1I7X380_HETBA
MQIVPKKRSAVKIICGKIICNIPLKVGTQLLNSMVNKDGTTFVILFILAKGDSVIAKFCLTGSLNYTDDNRKDLEEEDMNYCEPSSIVTTCFCNQTMCNNEKNAYMMLHNTNIKSDSYGWTNSSNKDHILQCLSNELKTHIVLYIYIYIYIYISL